MNQTQIHTLIESFSPKNLVLFFREKNRDFKPTAENLSIPETTQFVQGEKVGYIPFNNFENLGVYTLQVSGNLTERSGKKSQYDFAKRLLKETDEDAGIFVFYDITGNFRFSFVFANYTGKTRDYSNFRRFTYLVSPHLTNKTFLQRVGQADFKSLESIKEAFSVEKVTKDFYQEISYWYFWACQKSKFPEAAEKDANGRQESIIRMITRLIFIWFMREKGLVPSNLFEKHFAQDVLTELDGQSSSYYLAILQNLFFATLNTPKHERQFRSEIRGHRGYNPDFNNQYVYRYHSLFKNPEELEVYFQDIPFLNGGLFDCLDDKEHGNYIDGFTESAKKNRPTVPNELFFSQEIKADFNSELGTTNRNYKVEGLFTILSKYNFTIDENTVDDKEIALDPEMLGRVFENLLASFNPETSSTARKATGSYYTPREIVDYMVDESLKSYLREALSDLPDVKNKLSWLFSDVLDENPFSKSQIKQIIKAIENVRIVDPAVGSGAFPMGALHRMVSILSKLDPGSQLWQQAQLEATENIPDSQIREQVQASIRNYFLEKNPDYGRKLFLIQKCIYGVDIQPIAVEIAKLRFFISLLVEETVEKDKPNWGIEPLPNLDFKIMQGNSLISLFHGIDFSPNATFLTKVEDLFSEQDEKNILIKKFQNKKEIYQSESDHRRKQQLQKEIDQILIDLVRINALSQHADYAQELDRIDRKYAALPDAKVREDIIKNEKQKVSARMGIDLALVEEQMRQQSIKQWKRNFFPWTLYFAEVFTEKNGFDIVIGNPPYISALVTSKTENNLRKFYKEKYAQLVGAFDIYTVFLLIGVELATSYGVYAWIIPNKFLVADYAKKVRDYLLREGLHSAIDVSQYDVFENGVYPIIIFGNRRNKSKFNQYYINELDDLNHENLSLKQPMIQQKHSLFKDFDIDIQSGMTGFMAKAIIDLISEKKSSDAIPFIVSGSIDKYSINFNNVRYMGKTYQSAYVKYGPQLSKPKWEFWNKEKIVIAGMTKIIEAVYCSYPLGLGVGAYAIHNFGKFNPRFLLGLLNSSYFTFYLIENFFDKHLAGGYIAINKSTIKHLPLVIASDQKQEQIAKITMEIERRKEFADKLILIKLSRQIDEIVYDLFNVSERVRNQIDIKVSEKMKDHYKK